MKLSFFRTAREAALFCVPFTILIAFCIIYIAAGDSIYVIFHDQLDDNVPWTLMHVWTGGAKYYDGFMSGEAPLITPLWNNTFFFSLLPPATAFSANVLFLTVCAYVSFFAMARKLCVRHSLAVLSSFCFAILPFYSVHGLSAMGVPIFIYALLTCRDEKGSFAAIITLGAFFAFTSSFALVGYAVVIVTFLCLVVECHKRCWNKAKKLAALLLALFVPYVICNQDLFLQVVGLDDSFVSHRVDFEWDAVPFLKSVYAILIDGQYHATSMHLFIIPMIAITLLILKMPALRKRLPENEHTANARKMFYVCVSGIVLIAIFYGLWLSSPFLALRKTIGIGFLYSFQFDRFYFFYPTLWYLTLAFCGEIALIWFKENKSTSKILARVVLGSFVALTLLTMGFSAKNNTIVKTAAAQHLGAHIGSSVTWKQYYDEELFHQIESDLHETKGPQSNYRIVSLGMFPSIPLYNGFYCIDGYSGNYPLSYKHKMQKCFQDELDKSEVLTNYFGKVGGSRCYLYSAELGPVFMWSKQANKVINDLSINSAALKEMDCSYLFSGIRIENASDCNLTLFGTYETKTSYHRVYVYSIEN